MTRNYLLTGGRNLPVLSQKQTLIAPIYAHLFRIFLDNFALNSLILLLFSKSCHFLSKWHFICLQFPRDCYVCWNLGLNQPEGFANISIQMSEGGGNMENLTKCFMKQTDCVTREIAGETIIVPIKSRVGDLDSIFTLNEVGTMIWHLIDGHRNTTQIAEAVHQNYHVEPREIEKDTLAFLQSLQEVGLIHPARDDRPVGP